MAAERCTADLEGGTWELSPVQSDNAALVVASTVRRGLPARAATIGIATALQESRLVNIDYGDRDSVGLFQQRPSQGWGTVEQIMDPVYATHAFLDVLVEVEGYEALEITDAAQRVQRSGFPDAYAQHETRARAWASALTGWSPAAVTCALRSGRRRGERRRLPRPGGAGLRHAARHGRGRRRRRAGRGAAAGRGRGPGPPGLVGRAVGGRRRRDAGRRRRHGRGPDLDARGERLGRQRRRRPGPRPRCTSRSRPEPAAPPVRREPIGDRPAAARAAPTAAGDRPRRRSDALVGPDRGRRTGPSDARGRALSAGRPPRSRARRRRCTPGAAGRSSWSCRSSSRATARSSRACGPARTAG